MNDYVLQKKPKRVVLINEAFARKHFPNEDPIGQRIDVAMFENPTPTEIIGIVGDVNAICCASLDAISACSTTSNRQPKVTRALLKEAGIPAHVFDRNMSILEGSLGILPRRLLVAADQEDEAREILRDAGITGLTPPRAGKR